MQITADRGSSPLHRLVLNLLLHGASDFQVVRGDTLRQPAFFSGGNLATFDCVIANPPFSPEKWGDEVWASDPYGRNFAGMPPYTKNAGTRSDSSNGTVRALRCCLNLNASAATRSV